MREINGFQFFNIDHEKEVFVLFVKNKPYQVLTAPSDPEKLPKLFRLIISTFLGVVIALGKKKGASIRVGEFREADIAMTEADVLWYESKTEEGVFHPLNADEAISKWVNDDTVELYEVV